MIHKLLFSLTIALSVTALGARADGLSSEQKAWVSKGKRFSRAGWIYLHVEGDARMRGVQHGYLLAKEIGQGVAATKAVWEHDSGMDWGWFVKKTSAMFEPKIDAENLAELDGIAEGAAAAGVKVTRGELIAYNGYLELADYWWPQELRNIKDATVPNVVRDSCSSFVATGSWTRDGKIVLAHNTMQDYVSVLPNVIQDIAPSKGHRILWQTQPGWIHSGTDFFITDAGIVGSETTIGNFDGFATNGVPEFTRMRRATQDANSLDQWSAIMKAGNNGGYANAWLLGDINSGEIARLELGLKYFSWEKKKDGFFIGSNVAENRKILKLETERNDLDIRSSSVARRVRWKQLMKEYRGKIDLEAAKRFEGDHYDTYRGRTQPSGRTLCGHYDLDPDAGGQGQGVPFDYSGTVDGKVVDAAMAKNMSFVARFGSACGIPFEPKKFLAAHPQFDWSADLLLERPKEPWATFRAGE